MNRLFEISRELSAIARVRFDLRQQLETIARNITAQQAAIIPAGGWPGSNADTRKAAKLAARASDPGLIMFAADKAAVAQQLETLEVDRDALLAEHDAIIWTIRDVENIVRGGTSVFTLLEFLDHSQDEPPTAEMEF